MSRGAGKDERFVFPGDKPKRVSKETGWFHGSVKPTNIGPYKRKTSTSVIYSLWDGHEFKVGAITPAEAGRISIRSTYQSLPWRGLREDPSKAKG